MQNFTVLKINYTSILYKLKLNFKRNVSFIRCKRQLVRLFLAPHRKLRNLHAHCKEGDLEADLLGWGAHMRLV